MSSEPWEEKVEQVEAGGNCDKGGTSPYVLPLSLSLSLSRAHSHTHARQVSTPTHACKLNAFATAVY